MSVAEAYFDEYDEEEDIIAAFQAIGSLYSFVIEALPLVMGCNLTEAPHIRLICEELEAVSRGEVRRLAISIPPGYMKSMLVSVMWPAWEWLRDPSRTYLTLSGTPDAASRDSRRMRRLVMSDWYQALVDLCGQKWGVSMLDGSSPTVGDESLDRDTKGVVVDLSKVRNKSKRYKEWDLTKDQNAKMSFENTAGGARLCLSLNSKVTGVRASRIILDDPFDVNAARNGTAEQIRRRCRVVNKKVSELSTRRTKIGWAQVLIMQRLHPDDPAGQVEDNPSWRKVIMQAEFDPEFEHNYEHEWRTEPGQVIDPLREPLEDLKEIETDIGYASYRTQYQQVPTIGSGVIFTSALLDGIEYEGDPQQWVDKADELWASLDCAEGVNPSNDYTVCSIWARVGLDYYLVGGWCEKMEILDLYTAFEETMQKWPGLTGVLIEKESAGTQLYQTMRHKYPFCIPVNPRSSVDPNVSGVRDKETRAKVSILVALQAKLIHIPSPRWVPAITMMLEMLREFPGSGHDDAVDSWSQIIERFMYYAKSAPQISNARKRRALRRARF